MRTQSLIVKQYKTAQLQMVATLSPNSLTPTEKMSILLQLLLHYICYSNLSINLQLHTQTPVVNVAWYQLTQSVH